MRYVALCVVLTVGCGAPQQVIDFHNSTPSATAQGTCGRLVQVTGPAQCDHVTLITENTQHAMVAILDCTAPTNPAMPTEVNKISVVIPREQWLAAGAATMRPMRFGVDRTDSAGSNGCVGLDTDATLTPSGAVVSGQSRTLILRGYSWQQSSSGLAIVSANDIVLRTAPGE